MVQNYLYFRSEKIFGQTFTMATIRVGEEFTFQSPNSEDIQDLVEFFLDGLKRRSNYVIALQDYKPPSKRLVVISLGSM
jgi:myosin-7